MFVVRHYSKILGNNISSGGVHRVAHHFNSPNADLRDTMKGNHARGKVGAVLERRLCAHEERLGMFGLFWAVENFLSFPTLCNTCISIML